jgi:hypothetical protein
MECAKDIQWNGAAYLHLFSIQVDAAAVEILFIIHK